MTSCHPLQLFIYPIKPRGLYHLHILLLTMFPQRVPESPLHSAHVNTVNPRVGYPKKVLFIILLAGAAVRWQCAMRFIRSLFLPFTAYCSFHFQI